MDRLCEYTTNIRNGIAVETSLKDIYEQIIRQQVTIPQVLQAGVISEIQRLIQQSNSHVLRFSLLILTLLARSSVVCRIQIRSHSLINALGQLLADRQTDLAEQSAIVLLTLIETTQHQELLLGRGILLRMSRLSNLGNISPSYQLQLLKLAAKMLQFSSPNASPGVYAGLRGAICRLLDGIMRRGMVGRKLECAAVVQQMIQNIPIRHLMQVGLVPSIVHVLWMDINQTLIHRCLEILYQFFRLIGLQFPGQLEQMITQLLDQDFTSLSDHLLFGGHNLQVVTMASLLILRLIPTMVFMGPVDHFSNVAHLHAHRVIHAAIAAAGTALTGGNRHIWSDFSDPLLGIFPN